MSKQDFIIELRMALAGKLGSSQIDEHARYYEEYINAQIRNGKTEEEVLSGLGNPRLIARSILDAEGVNGGVNGQTAGEVSSSYRSAYQDGNADCESSDSRGYVQRKHVNLPGWLILLLVVLIILGIIGIVVAVVWWLAPLILVIWLFVFLVKRLR